MEKVLVVYGTRPEAIKMAPVVAELQRSKTVEPVVVVTGQHRAMLDQVNSLFGIVPRHDLDILEPRQRLEDVTARVLAGVSRIIAEEKPVAVLVQGDTTTCFTAALAAFYGRVPLIHLEAGLRTGDPANPFPEEINRRLTSHLASLHLAPTPTSCANLLAEGIARHSIVVTGNTVIDALHQVISQDIPPVDPALARVLGEPLVLVTAHRRESWGEPMANSARAIATLARRFPQTTFLLPAHLNPVVREVLLPPLLGLRNIVVTEPLCYSDFARAMDCAQVVLTDSGGVQEEAPSLGKPVVVMRETTERPEAIAAGTVELVGTHEHRIVHAVSRLLTDADAYDEMARAVNPYGDGHAASRSVDAIECFFGRGTPPEEFAPASVARNL